MTKNVTIYTKPGCPFCMAVKADLKLKGVAYREHNGKADAQRIEEKCYNSTVARGKCPPL